MINQARLADGTILERTAMQEQNGILWIYCYNNISTEEVSELLSDPEKTETITDVQPETEVAYSGYTVLQQINRDPCYTIVAEMHKPE